MSIGEGKSLLINWVPKSKLPDYYDGWKGTVTRTNHTQYRPMIDIRGRVTNGTVRIVIVRSNHHQVVGKYFTRHTYAKHRNIVRDQVMIAITTDRTACFNVEQAMQLQQVIEEGLEKYKDTMKVKDLEVLKWT
jgi:hypothetical protein